MRSATRLTLLAAAAALVLAGPASAVTVFTATLDGASQVPPNASTSTGTATLTLNAAQDRLEISLQVTGIDLDGLQTPSLVDDLFGAHIHIGAAGAIGNIAFGMVGPNNDTSGDLVIDGAAGTIFSAWDLTEGNGTTLAAQLGALFSEGLYLNLHTPAFGNAGEIRGQIVPEPGTLLLLAAGVAGLGWRRHLRP